MDFSDMETAPKDGTDILAWCQNKNGWTIAYWAKLILGGEWRDDSGMSCRLVKWTRLPPRPEGV